MKRARLAVFDPLRDLRNLLLLLFTLSGAMATVAVGQSTTPALAGGHGHSLALLQNGTVKAWGDNGGGQLGIGPTPYQISMPMQIPAGSLSGVAAIAAGADHCLALLSNGTVMTWGANGFGQLGVGNTVNQSIPQQIQTTGLSNVVAIAAGYGHCLALLSNGTVRAWGWNSGGELGIGNTVNQSTPQQIPASSLSNVVAVSAGSNHSMALLSNGTVKTWGVNQYGELGIGNTVNQSTPQQIPASSLSNVVAIHAGGAHNLALLANGTVKAWGLNAFGQLGIGSTTDQLAPIQVPIGSLSNVAAVAAGFNHSLALLHDGTVRSWGYDNYGQLGAGLTPFPFHQLTPLSIPASNLNNVSAIIAGHWHSFALRSDGAVKAWGWNSTGTLGLGYTSFGGVPMPQTIPGLCLSSAAAYTIQFGLNGNATLGVTIPCNIVTAGLNGQHYYFNAFSANPLNATSPGTGAWQGLHTTQAEVLSWLNWGTSGFPLALGSLGATGGAAASVAIAPGSLTGLTVYGVSVAFHPATLGVVANSSVVNHTF